MPMIDADGCPIHVEVEGPEDKPVLMLSNSLGTTLHMWDPQVAALTQHFRLVRYDRRGHGKSGVPEGPYTMEMLGRDVLAVLDALKIEKINWCGLSMGGMVGMWLGANAPQRIDRLILSNTSAYFADKEIWNGRIKTVREKGLAAIVGGTMERWFTAGFREREPEKIAWMQRHVPATDPEGYIACGEAVRDMDHREIIKSIKAPTMVIAGKQDPATHPRRRIHPQPHSGRKSSSSTPRISRMSSSRRLTRAVLGFLRADQKTRPVIVGWLSVRAKLSLRGLDARWVFLPQPILTARELENGRQGTPPTRHGETAARCSATPGSIAPMLARPTSTRSSRISSPAAPGASSGSGRISTSAPAASW